MTDTRKLKIDVSADTSQADAALKKTEAIGDQVAGGVTSSINKSIVGITSAISLIQDAYQAVEGALNSVVAASIEHENSLTRLEAVAGDSLTEVVTYANQLESQLAKDNDLFIEMGAKLAAITGARGKELTDMMQLTVQVSNLTGQSFEAAAKQVAKFVESGKAIRGLNIDIGGAATQSERLAAGIEKTKSGMDLGVASAGTYSGRLEAVKLALDNMNTVIGDTITKNDEVNRLMIVSKEMLDKLASEDWSALGEQVGTVAALGEVLIELGQILDDLQIKEVVTFAFGELGDSIRGLVGYFHDLGAGIEKVKILLGQSKETMEEFHKKELQWNYDWMQRTYNYRTFATQAEKDMLDAQYKALGVTVKEAEETKKVADNVGVAGENAEGFGDSMGKAVTYTEQLNARIDALIPKETYRNIQEKQAAEERLKWDKEFAEMDARFDKAAEERAAARKTQHDADVQTIKDLVALYAELDAGGKKWLEDQFPLMKTWVTQVEAMRDPVDKLRDALMGAVQSATDLYNAFNASIGGHGSITTVGGTSSGGVSATVGQPAGTFKGSQGYYTMDERGNAQLVQPYETPAVSTTSTGGDGTITATISTKGSSAANPIYTKIVGGSDSPAVA